MVLRRAPEGAAAARGRQCLGLRAEAQIIEQAARAGVPVPAVPLVLQPDMGLGEGYVMQHVAGETLGRRIVGDDPAGRCARAAGAAVRPGAGAHPCRRRRGLPPLRRAPAADELAYYEAKHREPWHAPSRCSSWRCNG